MNLPVPQTALSRAVERALVAGVVAVLGAFLVSGQVAEGSIAYFVIKTVLDLLNSNIANN